MLSVQRLEAGMGVIANGKKQVVEIDVMDGQEKQLWRQSM
jgi:hypothetical protein